MAYSLIGRVYQKFESPRYIQCVKIWHLPNPSLIIARIYPYCDKKNQKLISDHLRKCKNDVSQKSCEIYSHMVMNHIIKPNKDYEQQIFDNLSAMSKKDYDIFPTEYQDILAIMFNLYLNDLIVQTEMFKNILIGAEDDVLLFMSEKESFDYEKFNLEWLQKCNSKLLEDIAHNEVARYEISKKFAEEIEKGRVDSKLLKLYFKYFANIKDLE